jgi:hypothetical protein
MHMAAFASTTHGDIHGRGDRRSEMKVVHESVTMNVPTSPKASEDELLREFPELRTGSAATASAADRMKLFLILFYDLCRYFFTLCFGAGRVRIQRLVDTFDNRA